MLTPVITVLIMTRDRTSFQDSVFSSTVTQLIMQEDFSALICYETFKLYMILIPTQAVVCNCSGIISSHPFTFIYSTWAWRLTDCSIKSLICITAWRICFNMTQNYIMSKAHHNYTYRREDGRRVILLVSGM
jgi:hypothetical protein